MIKKIYEAITELPDDIVDEAAGHGAERKGGTGKSRKRITGRYAAVIAAALVCCILLGTVVYRVSTGGFKTGSGDMLLLQVNYPKAYSFDNREEAGKIRDQNPVEGKFYQALKNFSYETACALIEDGKNLTYSPVSLYYALAIAAEGAKGSTRDEIMSLLGYGETEKLAIWCHNLYNLLNKDNEIGKLAIRNSIWIDNDLSVNNEYVERLATQYYTESYYGDFADEKMAKAMAEWIKENTGGMESTQEPDEEMLLSIINTIYYSDEWIDKFDKKNTAEDDFYLSDGTTVRCDFLNSHYGSHSFARGEGYTRSSLSLKNNGHMVFVLPDEGISIYELVDTPEKLSECLEEGENYCGEVIWQIPKFSNDSELDLKNTLRQLGIEEAFTETADFSGIGNTGNELNNPHISTVIQNTHIEIDEKGVTASAFTQIGYAGAALPTDRAEMILDRPFLYAVVNSQGVILFIGICENPVS